MGKIAVSACLLGENCKYSGGNNKNEAIYKAKKEDAFAVAELAIRMWEETTVEELAEEFADIISSPVGYLEGIFVAEEYRKQGYAKQLLAACENWAREQGCTEFASD